MKILTAADNITDRKTSVALGIFDGVHRGHSAVIERAVLTACQMGYAPAVCTFPTGSVTTKGADYLPIYNDETKCVLLEEKGAEYVYMPDFTLIKNMVPEEFVSEILCRKMNAGALVCGRDFRFGKNAACDVSRLEELCVQRNMKLYVVDDVCIGNVRIASAVIRQRLREGMICDVNCMLGHDYTIAGEVIRGNKIGRTINFPTANQQLDNRLILPKFGVYLSYACIDGVIYKGVTNIGVKPTVEKNGQPLAETHFPDFEGDLYGRNIAVRLKEYIRPEKRFDSIEELTAQITGDTELCRNTELFPKG